MWCNLIYRQIGLNTNKLTVVEHKYNSPLEALVNTPIDIVSESEDLERYKSNPELVDKDFKRTGDNPVIWTFQIKTCQIPL